MAMLPAFQSAGLAIRRWTSSKLLPTDLVWTWMSCFMSLAACRRTEDRGKSSQAPDPLMILDTVRKALVNPDMIQILQEVVTLTPDERASLLGFIQRLGSTRRKSRRRSNPIRREKTDF